MDFGSAIEALKNGHSVARKGWNGKGMFIYLNKGSAPVERLEIDTLFIGGVSSDLFEAGDHDTAVRMPNINMRAADGSTVTGWLASQTDMFAEDWEVVHG